MKRFLFVLALAMLVLAQAFGQRWWRNPRNPRNPRNSRQRGPTTAGAGSRSWGATACYDSPEKNAQLPPFPAGTKIRVNCPEGYAYVATDSGDGDDREITCRNDGIWNKELGSCKRVGGICTKPSDPIRGRVVSHTPPIDEAPNKFPENGVINYACDFPYKMVGPPQLVCTSSSEWSPRQPPTCVENPTTTPPLPWVRTCYMPVIPTNGDIEEQSAPVADGTGLNFARGSFIRYICLTNYEPVGTIEIRCLPTGAWSEDPPTCRRSTSWGGSGGGGGGNTGRGCSRPVGPGMGSVVFVNPPGDPAVYPVGAEIEYECFPGYTTVGASTIYCQSNGQWSTTPPLCL